MLFTGVLQSLVDTPVGDIPDVESRHWTMYLTEIRDDIESQVACEGVCHLENCDYSVWNDEDKVCHFAVIDIDINNSVTDKPTLAVNVNLNTAGPDLVINKYYVNYLYSSK